MSKQEQLDKRFQDFIDTYGDYFDKDAPEIVVSNEYNNEDILIDQSKSGIPVRIKDSNPNSIELEYASFVNSTIEEVNLQNFKESLSIKESWIESSNILNLKAIDAKIMDSKFIETSIEMFDLHDVNVRDTSFNNTNLSFGEAKGSTWENVKFIQGEVSSVELDNAVLENVTFKDVEIENINFNNLKSISNVQFENCTFIDCTINSEHILEGKINLDEKSSESIKAAGNTITNQGAELESSKEIDSKNKERFFRLLTQLELFQEGPLSRQENDLLKATYSNEESYNIVFGLDDGSDQVYEVLYQGGEVKSLHPKNNELFEHLQTFHSHPDNIITDSNKSYLLSVSNGITRKIEEFEARKSDVLNTKPNSVRDFEKQLNQIFNEEEPVNRLKALNSFNSTLTERIEKYNKMEKILRDVHPRVKQVLEGKTYLPENDEAMKSLYQKFKNPEMFQSGAFKDLKTLKDVTTKIENLELQTVRKEGLEGELFKNPEQAIVMSRFDMTKPFQFDISSQESSYDGAANYFQKLVREQISEPKKIVEHYLTIRDSIQQASSVTYSNVDAIKLSEYAKRSLNEAIQVVEKAFEKEHPSYSELNLKVQNEVKYGERYEGEWIISETEKLAEPLKAISSLKSDEPISVLNLSSASNMSKEQNSYWKQKAEELIQFHVGRPIYSKDSDTPGIPDYSNAKKSLESIIDAERRNSPHLHPKLELKMMEYIENQETKQEKAEQKPLVEIER